MNLSILENRIIARIDAEDDEITFHMEDEAVYKMRHYQDCCETVTVEDICGDLEDIIGSPVITAHESTSEKNPKDILNIEYQDSFTWTFYKIDTIKGGVTIRWYGESNGYYSESVDFDEIKPPNPDPKKPRLSDSIGRSGQCLC